MGGFRPYLYVGEDGRGDYYVAPLDEGGGQLHQDESGRAFVADYDANPLGLPRLASSSPKASKAEAPKPPAPKAPKAAGKSKAKKPTLEEAERWADAELARTQAQTAALPGSLGPTYAGGIYRDPAVMDQPQGYAGGIYRDADAVYGPGLDDDPKRRRA